jgi:acyl-CoA synthetase (AMP-forming)/AMP-acid ligase II
VQFNLADLFECVADTVPERVALVCGDDRLSYARLDGGATQLAHVLRDAGVDSGAHVGCCMRNSTAHLEMMLAAFKLRAVPVNINYRYTETELAYLVDDADLVALVHDEEHAEIVEHVKTVGSLRFTIVGGSRAYEDSVRNASSARDFDTRSGDDRYVLYTGGTTGMPKGVVWRHEDIFFAAMGGGNPGGPPITRPEDIAHSVVENPAQRLRPFLPRDDPGPPQFVSLALGPLMHASGQWSAFGTLLGGGKVVLYDAPSVDMAYVLALVEREEVNALNLVGDTSARPLLDTLAQQPERWDTSSLRLLGSGGTALAGASKDALLEALPSVLAIVEGIGSSESPAQAVAVTTRHSTSEAARSLTFAAKAETMIVDEELQPLPRGTGAVGRLATRGRVPLGYYKDVERTARTFVDIEGERWSLPGDMATIDADGTVHLLGRGSLCINTGGEKVYPEEVEAVVKTHDTIADAVVMGAPDDERGECVAAIVVAARDAAPDLDAVQQHCRKQLAGYKVPRRLYVVDEITRTATGKPDYAWANDLIARRTSSIATE